MDYTPKCRCGVQVDRYPDDGLPRRVFGGFMTARMGVSVGRSPQEVLLEEFYRSGCSETVRVDVYMCSKSFRLCLTVVY
jgi:hypothetical protein